MPVRVRHPRRLGIKTYVVGSVGGIDCNVQVGLRESKEEAASVLHAASTARWFLLFFCVGPECLEPCLFVHVLGPFFIIIFILPMRQLR